MPSLTLSRMGGSDDGRIDVVPVDASNAVVTIGRLPECAICIAEDPDASRRHARIFWRDGEWWLEDMGSANGTFVGEFAQSLRIAAPTRILAGQIFRVGLTRFRLEKEGYQMREFRMAAQVTVSAAHNARG